MTEVEKEFIEYVKSHNPDFSVSLVRLALKLIARYPQVLAEKVWEGDVGTIFANGKCVYQTEFFDMPNKEWKNHLKKVQLFVREVVDA